MTTIKETPLSIDARVGKVETALGSLHDDVTGLKGDMRVLAATVTKGFEDVRRDAISGRQTNWGWIASFVGVSIGLVGYFASSLISPLLTNDRQIEARLDRVQTIEMQSFERSIRAEERIASLKEQLVKQSDDNAIKDQIASQIASQIAELRSLLTPAKEHAPTRLRDQP